MSLIRKQPQLKPQDVVVAIRYSLNRHINIAFSKLALDLKLSISEVHGAFKRAQLSGLINSENEYPSANRIALKEFLIHGLKFSFPAYTGGMTRGVLTGLSGSSIRSHFSETESLPFVWPDADGADRGVSLLPLYPTLPSAAKRDPELHEILSLIDIIRIGAAREREIAESELRKRI